MSRLRGELHRHLARRLLRLVFAEEEAAEIVRDVAELTEAGEERAGGVAFWRLIAAYPLLEGWEWVRSRMTRGEGMTMGGWTEDVRFAWRGLRRRPGFALMALVILGTGFGSVVAVQSVVEGVLLEPLPFPKPERLQTLWMTDRERSRVRMTPGNLRDAAALADVFAGVAAFQRSESELTDPASGATIILRGAHVTPAYFRTLGVVPIRGRDFTDIDGDPDSESVVILGQHVWTQLYGEDADVVGREVEIGGYRSRVIGVVPRGVYPTTASVAGRLPFVEGEQDYFRLIRFRGDYWDLRGPHFLGAVARLRDGVAPAEARAALDVLSGRLRAEHAPNEGESIVMSPLTEEVVGDVRFGLVTLMVVVGLVFVISAVNVGSLFLLRADERSSEVELLGAIGAPRERLSRQRVAEAALVTLVGAAGGVAVGSWLVEAMRRLVPFQIPRLAQVSVEPSAAGTALLLAGVLAYVLGVVPLRLGGSTREGRVASRVSPGRRQGRAHAALVAAQAGLAVIVLVGALLLTRSFAALRANDPGYAAGETWVLGLQGSDYDRGPVLERVRAVPGVAEAALTYDHPLERGWQDGFQLLSGAAVATDSADQATIRPYGEGYFRTVGVELVEGRIPDVGEHLGERRLALVNEAFQRAHMDGPFTEGRERVRVPSGDRRLGEGGSVFAVVGVVEDVRFLGPAIPSEPAIYIPFEHFAVTGSTLMVRPEVAGVDALPAVRAAIAAAAPGVAIDEAGTLETLRNEALARPRFNMMLLAVTSGVALLLCTLGAYGVVSRTVVTRRREIGVRAALGAEGPAITRTVAGRTLRPLGLGVLVGLGVALFASRLLESLVYEVAPTDPLSLLGAPVILLAVGGLGAVVPALRALAVDPAESLRAE